MPQSPFHPEVAAREIDPPRLDDSVKILVCKKCAVQIRVENRPAGDQGHDRKTLADSFLPREGYSVAGWAESADSDVENGGISGRYSS